VAHRLIVGFCARGASASPIERDALTTDEYLETLRSLVERWCDERRLEALSRILPRSRRVHGVFKQTAGQIWQRPLYFRPRGRDFAVVSFFEGKTDGFETD